MRGHDCSTVGNSDFTLMLLLNTFAIHFGGLAIPEGRRFFHVLLLMTCPPSFCFLQFLSVAVSMACVLNKSKNSSTLV